MISRIPDLIDRRARLGPHSIALEEAESGRSVTYAELDRRACAAASLMAQRQVSAGDRVALLCHNRIEFFELLFACAKLGAVLVPMNWRMPAAELDGLFADCEPNLVFHDSSAAGIVEALDSRPPSIDLDRDYPAFRDEAAPRSWRALWPEDSTWYLLYTSGTTGRPKGVIYTFRMALANHVSIGSAIGLGSNDRTVAFLPNFYTAGINLHALPTLIAGGQVTILDGFDVDALIALFEARRIDTFFAVPTIYQELIGIDRFTSAPLGSVRHWGCGGAPLPDRLVEQYRPLGLRICNGMGMTETGPTAFLMDPADAWDRIGSVGRPQLLSSVRIVDQNDREVPVGEVGELLFAGPGITPGYWRNEEATRAAFTSDGWLRSGDLMRCDEAGFHYVVGRRKEMFISGGENVYPAEVEKILCAHPDIIDAAVVGKPDPRWGEVGHAFIQLAPPSDLDGDSIAAWCRHRLATYKIPRRFDFVDEFPRTSSGKIQKHQLA